MQRLLLLAILVFAACDDGAPASVAQPAEAPSELQFPLDAAATRFMYYDSAGKRVVTSDRDKIPAHLTPYVAVLLGERTAAVQGQVFQWDAASDGRIGTARRVDESSLIPPSKAAWAAHDAAMLVWEKGSGFLPATDSPSEGVTLKMPAKFARDPVPRSRKPVVAAKPAIEIVGINDSVPQGMEPSKTLSWKPVTVYYSANCGRCTRAMSWMDNEGVPYRKRDVANASDNEAMWAIARRNGHGGSVSLPVIVVGNERQVMTGWNTRKFTKLAKR